MTIASGAFCNTGDAEDGVIEIHGKLTLQPGAIFDASEPDTAKLWIQNNVVVGSGAILNLGCGLPEGPEDTAAPTVASSSNDCFGDYLNGALLANNALAVIIHTISIRGDININGGGGGVTCDNISEDLPFPAYVTVHDSIVNGAINISNLESCWLGVIRTQVRGNVVIQNNEFADPDATEIVTNVINGRLDCSANSPAAQFGDSGGLPNIVRGGGHGECVPPLSNK